jgi:predicted anti-sigma-YlaC factor YlaD
VNHLGKTMAPFRIFKRSPTPHEEAREHASDYLDGDAPAPLKERIRLHLEECPDCRGFIGTLRATIAALRNLPTVEPPPSTEERIKGIGRGDDGRSKSATS